MKPSFYLSPCWYSALHVEMMLVKRRKTHTSVVGVDVDNDLRNGIPSMMHVFRILNVSILIK
jgi:hypothetical protein